MSGPDRQWGIRSRATGTVYPWAHSEVDAAFMLAGTGVPDRYEVVHLCGPDWIAHDVKQLPPTPDFARRPLRERYDEDDEVLRYAIHLAESDH